MTLRAGQVGLPILTYHTFSARRAVTSTDPAWFAECLAALLDAGYHAVDLEDWLARGRPDEPRGFALTIDDGLRSVLRVTDLVLRDAVPATIFLVTDRVGSDNTWPGQPRGVAVEPTLDWSEIASLAAIGFKFASHGRSHARLGGLDDTSLERELRGSREAIEDRLGRPCPLLAYPYGESTAAVRALAARHYAAAFGTRLAFADGSQDLHDLARIDAYYIQTRPPLVRVLEGRARGWLRRRCTLRTVRRHVKHVLSGGGVAG
jgi:peptidoglycan/xylan/chitin deacetylase (PgdA/CDA1 family)